jgi:hypothetical protein
MFETIREFFHPRPPPVYVVVATDPATDRHKEVSVYRSEHHALREYTRLRGLYDPALVSLSERHVN